MRTALVAGANGLIGRRIAAHLHARGWHVIAVSRRAATVSAQQSVTADLTDADSARTAFAGIDRSVYVFYAARYDHPEGIAESVELNASMLRNLLDALQPGARIQHVNLMQGTKYYGHPGPIPLPVTEETPRGSRPTFYFAQEDLVRERAAREGWHWSAARPHIFCDADPGHPRSIALVIAVYAAIKRERGEALDFPGSEKSFGARTQFTDTHLLARAAEWMATASVCANQAFNVVNGDAPRWCELWRGFAAIFGMRCGEPRDVPLAQYMADKSESWDALVRRHALAPTPLARIALWDYGDYVFRPEWDIMSSMNRARRCGFSERLNTQEMFARAFAGYRNAHIVP